MWQWVVCSFGNEPSSNLYSHLNVTDTGHAGILNNIRVAAFTCQNVWSQLCLMQCGFEGFQQHCTGQWVRKGKSGSQPPNSGQLESVSL